MRILMLSQFFYPPTIGGEERFVADLSQDLVARGHEVTVVTLSLKGYPAFEIYQGIRIHRVRGAMQQISMLFSESDRQYAPPFPDPGVVHQLRRIIGEEQPDIVHAHNWLVHSFTPLRAKNKAKFVMSLHDYSLVCTQKRLLQRGTNCSGPGLKKCLECSAHFYGLTRGPLATLANFFWAEKERQAVDLFLPVSQAAADGNQMGKYKASYKVVPNFIPDHIDSIDDDDPLLSQLPEGDFLLFVGDITFDKGAEVLLQAYAEINTQVPLVLIGRQFLTGLSEQLLHNVFLMGIWPHSAVMAAWKRSTIALVPSIVAETFGIVALEAMYMGKPVIAARSGGLADIVVHDESGLLVPPGDPRALREAIEELLGDPDRRERIGKAAKLRAERFQAKTVVSQIEAAYRELLDASAPDKEGLQTLLGKGEK